MNMENLFFVMIAKNIGEETTSPTISLIVKKTERGSSGLDWNLIFETLNNIRDEIRDNFPYKVLEVEGAEDDDCIATIVEYISTTPNAFEKVLVYIR